MIEGLGFELLGIERAGGAGSEVLRLYIDHADGITVDDCEAVSRQVSGVLDVENAVRGAYTLEVSSPGIDRPLFTLDQYRRFVGEAVVVRLRQPLESRRNWRGTLAGVTEDAVVMEIDGEKREIPFAGIDRGRLQPEWPEPMRPGPGNKPRNKA
ncbi:MAG: ribosome maturation factor RimP [Erythrobacter sp.]|nr:ribosome maturation factor RimP [Erythrobacter sp.]